MEYDRSTKPLPDSEIRELIKLAQAGDLQARNAILLSNTYRRLNFASHYRRTHWDCTFTIEDLADEALLGEITAIERFKFGYGAFSTYATWWMRFAIQAAIRDGNGLIRRSSEAHRLVGRSRRADCGEFTTKERTLISKAQRASQPILCPGGVTSAPSPAWNPSDFDAIEEQSMEVRLLREAIERLPEKLRFVIEQRMKDPKLSLQEIGRSLGVTKERVRQIELQAHQRIRNYILWRKGPRHVETRV